MRIGFIRFDFQPSELAAAPVWFAGIFLFTAVPEEFLFRGLIQNWLARVTRSGIASVIIGAIIFGASHLNNGLAIPNYRYFLMASVAGIFYGRAWRNSESIMASSLTHALVDTVWSVFFR
jgi:membrane protease YdiL (CAAX protease family)